MERIRLYHVKYALQVYELRLEPNEAKVLKIILAKPNLGQSELSNEVGISRQWLPTILIGLETKGIIENKGKGQQGTKHKWVVKDEREAKELIRDFNTIASFKERVDIDEVEKVKIPYHELITQILKPKDVEDAAKLGAMAEKNPLINLWFVRNSEFPYPNVDDKILRSEEWMKELGTFLNTLIYLPIFQFIEKESRLPDMDEVKKLKYSLNIDIDFSHFPSHLDRVIGDFLDSVFKALESKNFESYLVRKIKQRRSRKRLRWSVSDE